MECWEVLVRTVCSVVWTTWDRFTPHSGTFRQPCLPPQWCLAACSHVKHAAARGLCSLYGSSRKRLPKQRTSTSRTWDLPRWDWAVAPWGRWAWSGFVGRQGGCSKCRVPSLGGFRKRVWVSSGLPSWQLELPRPTRWRLERDGCEKHPKQGVVPGTLLNMPRASWLLPQVLLPTLYLPGNKNKHWGSSEQEAEMRPW